MSSFTDEYADTKNISKSLRKKQDKKKKKRILQVKMKEMKEKFRQYYKRNMLHIEDTIEHDQKAYQELYEECSRYLDELTKRNEELAKRK